MRVQHFCDRLAFLAVTGTWFYGWMLVWLRLAENRL